MRQFFLIIGMLICLFGNTQTSADPATGQLDIKGLNNESLNANQLQQNQKLMLAVPVYNLSQASPIPAGTCKLKINIGSRLSLDAFSQSNAPLKQYFNYTIATVGNSTEITGDLIAPIPSDFAAIVDFPLTTAALGSSEITINFQVTNHNTTNTLSDEDGQNNFTSLQYMVAAEVVPVKFTKVLLSNLSCGIKVFFAIENEVDVRSYDIEYSTDGANYKTGKTLPAVRALNYSADLLVSDWKIPTRVFVRIKSIDLDGTILISEVKLITLTCGNSTRQIAVAPNPVHHRQTISVISKSGTNFLGFYTLSIINASGKTVQSEVLELKNVIQFNFIIQNPLINGHYYLKLTEKSNAHDFLVKFYYM